MNVNERESKPINILIKRLSQRNREKHRPTYRNIT